MEREDAGYSGEIDDILGFPSRVAHGANLRRRLTHELSSRAHALGHRRKLLDTLQDMIFAQALYRSPGLRDTARHNFDPLPGVIYMELAL